MKESIFSKIIKGEVDAEILHEDEYCIAIKDIQPQAPVHILIIPRKAIPQLSKQEPEDKAILGHLLSVAPKIAAMQGIGGKYRLVINDGIEAGQTVFHLHLHLIGGRPLGWPPG